VAAAASILIAVVILGTAVQMLLDRHLHEALDTTLRNRAAEIARLNASAPTLLKSASVLEASVGPNPLEVEVVNRRGAIVTRSPSLGGSTIPAGALVRAALSGGRAGYENGRVGDQEARIYVAPLADFGGPASGGAVIVAASTEPVSSTLAESRALILLSALAAAVLVVPIAFLLAGRALVPLRRLAEGAEAIEQRGDPAMRLAAGSLDGRVPDEVGRLADTLNRMLSALESARDLERRFIADASHELRNPLAALRGNADYLARNGADPQALGDLRSDAERLTRLVEELLALAREDATELPQQEVRLDEVASAAADGQVRVRVADPGWVRGDRPSLERALLNLVSNARRHGPAGEPIEVEVSRHRDRVLLSVVDRGPGIPADQLELASRRFWRGAGVSGEDGSGLGLALVKATAERHGGRLAIEGSRFTIELPALTRISEPTATTPAEPSEGHQ
jgi:two-component system, OmpR family, sensor kinase